MTEIYFRHSKIRQHQSRLISDAYGAIGAGNHFLAHAPCGIGKTDAVLSAAITYGVNNGLDVFFLTPKISQHKIAAETVKGIADKYSIKLRAVDLVGRKTACVNPVLDEMDYDGFYQSCEKLRRDEKCPFYAAARGSTLLGQAKSELLFEKTLKNYGSVKRHGEFMREMSASGACPYEMMLKLSPSCNVVIGDYSHIVDPQIRMLFMGKSNKLMDHSIIIIDEAHNLPHRVGDHLSSSLNNRIIMRMEKEMRTLGTKMEFEEVFCEWAKARLGKEREVEVKIQEFAPALSYFQMGADELASFFDGAGLAFIEKTGKKSSLFKFAKFIKNWILEDQSSIRILKGSGDFFSLSKRGMDPAIMTSSLNDAHSCIIMSATLNPMPMYRDLLGLDPKRTVMESYPSPFPKSNRLSVIVDGVTTKFTRRNSEEYLRIAGAIDLVHSTRGGQDWGTAVFFPSYDVMNSIVPLLKSSPKFIQQERCNSAELHNLAKSFSQKGGMLIGVQGGSLSEGLDFGNEEIKSVIVVGIALEEMGLEIKALIDYYQRKFGKGWEYAYIYPAVVRAMQAAGRAIRKETDKAAIIYMDERFNWPNYRRLLPKDEPFVIASPLEIEKLLSEFWDKKAM